MLNVDRVMYNYFGNGGCQNLSYQDKNNHSNVDGTFCVEADGRFKTEGDTKVEDETVPQFGSNLEFLAAVKLVSEGQAEFISNDGDECCAPPDAFLFPEGESNGADCLSQNLDKTSPLPAQAVKLELVAKDSSLDLEDVSRGVLVSKAENLSDRTSLKSKDREGKVQGLRLPSVAEETIEKESADSPASYITNVINGGFEVSTSEIKENTLKSCLGENLNPPLADTVNLDGPMSSDGKRVSELKKTYQSVKPASNDIALPKVTLGGLKEDGATPKGGMSFSEEPDNPLEPNICKKATSPSDSSEEKFQLYEGEILSSENSSMFDNVNNLEPTDFSNDTTDGKSFEQTEVRFCQKLNILKPSEEKLNKEASVLKGEENALEVAEGKAGQQQEFLAGRENSMSDSQDHNIINKISSIKRLHEAFRSFQKGGMGEEGTSGCSVVTQTPTFEISTDQSKADTPVTTNQGFGSINDIYKKVIKIDGKGGVVMCATPNAINVLKEMTADTDICSGMGDSMECNLATTTGSLTDMTDLTETSDEWAGGEDNRPLAHPKPQAALCSFDDRDEACQPLPTHDTFDSDVVYFGENNEPLFLNCDEDSGHNEDDRPPPTPSPVVCGEAETSCRQRTITTKHGYENEVEGSWTGATMPRVQKTDHEPDKAGKLGDVTEPDNGLNNTTCLVEKAMVDAVKHIEKDATSGFVSGQSQGTSVAARDMTFLQAYEPMFEDFMVCVFSVMAIFLWLSLGAIVVMDSRSI